MIVDTSVWIEFFRTSDSTASRWVSDHIADGTSLVVPEVVLMELLIGTTDEQAAAVRRRFVQRFAIERSRRFVTSRTRRRSIDVVAAAGTSFAALSIARSRLSHCA